MKKILVTLLFLLVIIFTVGCVKPPVKEELKPSDFLTYWNSTIATYEDATSGNILINMESEVTTSLEYIYNYETSSINSLLCVLERGDSVMAAYVKEGFAYINVNNEKTKMSLSNDETATILENYSLTAMAASIFAVFDKSLFNAFTITSDADGKVVLTWDPSKYVLMTDGLDDDEFLAATERFDDISENMKSIVVTITYENKLVTKIESLWTKQNDSVAKIDVTFRGIGQQTINYPSDLSEYKEQN